jgi:signal transduction histidine kinase
VRSRIIGLAVWTSVLAIVLFGMPLGVAVLSYFQQVERSDLQQAATAVAITVAADVNDGDRIDQEDVNDVLLDHDAVTVAVYGKDGNWFGGSRRGGGGAEVVEALDGSVGEVTDGPSFVVAVPVTHEDDVIGAVRATAPRAAALERALPVWGAMAVLAGLAVSIAWLVGRRHARGLAHPLEDVAVAARRLGDGDFSVRARTGGIPEIDAVVSALNSTATRLDDLLARERAFSADASHQLRTPLAALRLRLEGALELPGQDLRPAVVASLAETDRLTAIVEELLTLARDQRGERADPIDLVALLGDLDAGWRERLALQGRELHRSVQDGVPDPRSSAAAVRQVLAVLVDNATMHGSGTVSVTVREAPGAVAIDVADEGRGVQEVTSLFARPADERNGHGIGLALARRLAESQLGRLELTRPSPPVFTLLLPTAVDGAPDIGPGAVPAADDRVQPDSATWSGAPSSSR